MGKSQKFKALRRTAATLPNTGEKHYENMKMLYSRYGDKAVEKYIAEAKSVNVVTVPDKVKEVMARGVRMRRAALIGHG